jgi:dolichyl-phosphate-mannose-protein mannosyltransferase
MTRLAPLRAPTAAGTAEPRVSAAGPRRFALLALTVAVLAGAALRLWLALGPHSGVDSDEAIVGLMAFRLLHHGEIPPAFFWGQNYGGSLEAFFVAPFLWLFGTSALGLRTASIGLGLVTAWLTWRVGRRLFSVNVAAFVGLLALFWPLALVWFGTRERGFYPATAVCGMAVVLLALRIDATPAQPRHWIALGFATGVGWWLSVNIAYYALPIATWLVVRGHWRQVRNIAYALAAAAAGAAVWIAASFTRGWTTLDGPEVLRSSSFFERFKVFWERGLPYALGLRHPVTDAWYGNAALARAAYLAVLVAAVFLLRKRSVRESPEVFLLAFSPFVFAAYRGNFTIGDGRYTYFLASLLPLLFGRLVSIRLGRVVVALVLVISTFGFVWNYREFAPRLPGSTRPLADELRAAGYRTAAGDYWVTFKMTYESGERVIAAPVPGMRAPRSPEYARMIASSAPAYVFFGTGTSRSMRKVETTLARRRVGYRVIRAGRYSAILPDTRVTPTESGIVPPSSERQ